VLLLLSTLSLEHLFLPDDMLCHVGEVIVGETVVSEVDRCRIIGMYSEVVVSWVAQSV
jgi:hypothetical protein